MGLLYRWWKQHNNLNWICFAHISISFSFVSKSKIARAALGDCFCMWYESLKAMIAGAHTNTINYSFWGLEPIGWVVVLSATKCLHIVHELQLFQFRGESGYTFLQTLNNTTLHRLPTCFIVVTPQRSFMAITDNWALNTCSRIFYSWWWIFLLCKRGNNPGF